MISRVSRPCCRAKRVQFVDERHPQREIRVGEQLDGLSLGAARQQHRGVRLLGALHQDPREGLSLRPRVSDDDARRVQVVVQGTALTQELRREQDRQVRMLLPHSPGEPDRDRRLDHNRGRRRKLRHLRNHALNAGGVEEVQLGVVIRRRRNDDEVRAGKNCRTIRGRPQRQITSLEELRDQRINHRRPACGDVGHAVGRNVHGRHVVMLGQQHRHRSAHVAEPEHRDPHEASSLGSPTADHPCVSRAHTQPSLDQDYRAPAGSGTAARSGDRLDTHLVVASTHWLAWRSRDTEIASKACYPFSRYGLSHNARNQINSAGDRHGGAQPHARRLLWQHSPTSVPSPTASSTALPAGSTDATQAASEAIKAASAKPIQRLHSGCQNQDRQEVGDQSVRPTGRYGVSPEQANGYQRPAANANGYVGPSEEYYSYNGYVQPGFEYQVGSECFDPALGRCKSSGEVQSEWLQLQASQNG